MPGNAPDANPVIRTYVSARRPFLLGALFLLGAFALYVTYEFGRAEGGYDRVAAARERATLEARIEQLEEVNRELRAKLAELDTLRIGQTQERAEVARTIGELQEQVARQAQELAFYRGIVAQGVSSLGVTIQQMRISPAGDPGRFRVRLTLVRSARPDNVISGTVLLTAEGLQNGRRTSLDLGGLTGGKLRELPFRFRYFESLDQEIALPAGFDPQRLMVEVRSSRRGVAPLSRSFQWIVDRV